MTCGRLREYVDEFFIFFMPVTLGTSTTLRGNFFQSKQNQKYVKNLADKLQVLSDFYTPPHNSGGALWFHVGRPCVCPSSYVHFSIPDDNLSKHQWIFTKFGMCIDIVEIWFGITNGQISSNFYGVICPRHAHIFISG